MRNKILPLFLGALLSANYGFSQKCGTYEGSFENEKNKFPEFYQSIESKNSELQQKHLKALSQITTTKEDNGVKIIPVVVHVIHDLGSENISDASIQGALDILNANINGQGANFLNKTPDIFAAVRGDLKVEFRLAKLDPDGNPTTGINRVRSTLTDEPEPRDAVKSLSYWNSYQYLNIWTLKKFAPQNDGNTLLGYAQFPFSGSMSTDGVVLLASQMISGGTLTHECGHWLGLRHVWGDAVCGDDGVKDTPPAREANFGINLSDFPYHVGNIGLGAGCIADSLNPAGEMFVNYMDYSSDADVTMFTKGQNEVMNITLDGVYDEETGVSGIGFREYMWSAENIVATGTSDGYITPTCTQEATFNVMGSSSSICEGEAILLKGNKTMFGSGNVNSMLWDFGDGNTDNSGDNFLSHDYLTVGSYDVSLTVEYNETTEARASSLVDLDIANASSYDSITSTLIIQGTLVELEAENATNINLHIDEDAYSTESYWKMNMFYIDSVEGAFNIDTFNVNVIEDKFEIYINGVGNNQSIPDSVLVDNTDSVWVLVDGDVLTSQNLSILEASEEVADSSNVWYSNLIIDHLDSIVDYNFYYDTAVFNIVTFIDSTYLSFEDSSLLSSADTTWFSEGILNTSDSIRIYFAQFNNDTTITISVNTDTTQLSTSDSLMYADADSIWNVNAYIGWVDTLRTYYGTHYYTKYNGFFADTLFYRGNVEKKTYIAYYSNSCISTTSVENYITVGSAISSSNAGLYTYSFENESELNNDWVLNQSTDVISDWNFNSAEFTQWQWNSSVAVDGTSSIMINREGLMIGSTEIISKAYDLSALSNPAIKFSWAGAASNTFPVNELIITYSDNCGEDWNSLGTINAVLAANAGLYTNNFKPNTSEWNDTVMTKNQLSGDNIRFKFEYVISGNTNNFYLDNIQIGEESALMSSNNTISSRLSVFPNPTNGDAVIAIENLANIEVEVSLINILGSKVLELYNGVIVSNYNEISTDLSSLDKGIYFVNVTSNGNTIMTDKLILK